MVTVKLFGVFRLDSGVKELKADAKTVRELFPLIIAESKKTKPDSNIDLKYLKGCIVSLNGKQVSMGAKLQDGDMVMLVPAVAGG